MEKEGPPPAYDPTWDQNAQGNFQQPVANEPVSKGQPPQAQPYPVQQYQYGGYQQQPQTVYQQPYGYDQQPYGYQPAGVVMAQPYTGPVPDSHTFLAWLTCLFCCWPLGLISIFKSMEVNSALTQGDLPRAQNASKSARKFGMLSLAFGILSYIGLVIFMVLYFVLVLPHIMKKRNLFDD